MRHVAMTKSLCEKGCGHPARGGSHGSRKIQLAADADPELVLAKYGERAKLSPSGTSVIIPNCPPSRGIHGEHRRRVKARKRRARRDAMFAVKRGEAIAGIHKVSASSSRARSSKKQATSGKE